MKIAVVGLGYWGPNLVRNFSSSGGVSQVMCYDLDKQRSVQTVKMYPHVKAASSFDDILKSDCDGVVIATPISLHHQMGIKALKHGKHVLMEKPLALNSKECEDLVRTAEDNKLVLMVDHTFLYTGAVRKMKEIVASGEVGDVYYFDSVRVNLGLFQHDVNVLWDLAPHDLSIMDFILPLKPTGVSAIGINHFNHMEDMAYLAVRFGEKMIAHIHVNWLAPVKIRRILIGGSKKMIVYDDMEPSEKVKVYDTGVRVVTKEGIYRTLVEYRTGDMSAPKLDYSEALGHVVKDFIRAMKSGQSPNSDGHAGMRVVRILEAAEQSMKRAGSLVQLS